MRYEELESISFENNVGKSVLIKPMREYDEAQTDISIEIKNNDKLDEIVSRREIWGDGTEGEAYKICDHNIVVLFENDFNLSKIKRLNIPVR